MSTHVFSFRVSKEEKVMLTPSATPTYAYGELLTIEVSPSSFFINIPSIPAEVLLITIPKDRK